MELRGKKRKYESEFKRESVKIVLAGGRVTTEVAKGLGINENVLYRWLR